MNKLAHQHEANSPKARGRTRDWRKSMSDHVAYALLAYTGLQIFLTVKAMSQGVSSILPYFALIAMVAAMIPLCRWFEKRWSGLTDEQAADAAYLGSFRRDAAGLWALAISLPLVLTVLFKAVL